MFTNNHRQDQTGLEKAIDKVMLEMSNVTSDTDEYKKMVEQLTKLYALQKMEKDTELQEAEYISKQKLNEADARLKELEAAEKVRNLGRRWNVSPDVLAAVLGNIAGILIIVGHERAHVVTSKALQFLKAAR